MRIYLDSNVYSYLVQTGDVRAGAAYFRGQAATVLVSDSVVIEAARIPDRDERLARVAAIRAVGNLRIDPPFTFRQALEIRREIMRCRPEWLRTAPDESTIERWLALNRRVWKRMRNDVLFDPAVGLPPFLAVVEPATATSLEQQRKMRQILLNHSDVQLCSTDSELQGYLAPLPQFDRHWRVNSSHVWAMALEGDPALRDSADYLRPYLARLPDRRDWDRFWLRDIVSEAMPLGRLHSAAEYHQFSVKVDHGNVIDTHHAVHLADCDLLLTCDRRFFTVLQAVQSEAIATSSGRPVFVERRSGLSALAAISAAMEGAA